MIRKTEITRVLLIETDELFRFKVMDVLRYEKNIEITGDCIPVKEALRKADILRPDIIILDTNLLADIDGIDFYRRFFEVNTSCDILMFGSGRNNIETAIKSGATWYFPKDIEPGKLASVIRMTKNGRH